MNVIRLLQRFGQRSNPERRRGDCAPASLIRRMDALRLIIRKGGPGSDLAAAEMSGIQHTIMELGRASSGNRDGTCAPSLSGALRGGR